MAIFFLNFFLLFFTFIDLCMVQSQLYIDSSNKQLFYVEWDIYNYHNDIV